jgi:hypothetical protein
MNLYRYYDHWTGTDRVDVYLHSFYVYKETPNGWWINDYGKKRWVSKTSRKKFAYPTIEQAKESFKYRKERQMKILDSQIKKARLALLAPLPNEYIASSYWRGDE